MEISQNFVAFSEDMNFNILSAESSKHWHDYRNPGVSKIRISKNVKTKKKRSTELIFLDENNFQRLFQSQNLAFFNCLGLGQSLFTKYIDLH